jgi:hypothetical protein
VPHLAERDAKQTALRGKWCCIFMKIENVCPAVVPIGAPKIGEKELLSSTTDSYEMRTGFLCAEE